MILSKKLAREWKHLCPGLCSGCGSGHSLGGISWSHPAWGRLWLRREPLAAAPGDRELRPGREQGKDLRLGHRGASPSPVCAKGLGEALGTQQGVLGTTAPPPQTPGPKVPCFCLLWRQACVRISQLPLQPVCFSCREHGDRLLPGSSPGESREFEAGMASARIRKQLLTYTLIKDIKSNRIRIAQ